jgi:hypothetical protein
MYISRLSATARTFDTCRAFVFRNTSTQKCLFLKSNINDKWNMFDIDCGWQDLRILPKPSYIHDCYENAHHSDRYYAGDEMILGF